jgi:hypothetical protein
MVQARPNPSPTSLSSHIFRFTDPSSPLSNNSTVSFESPSKKRKIGNSEVECSALPVLFASESTHTQVHKIIKKECEELIELIVHLLFLYIFYLFIPSQYRIKPNCGSHFRYQSKWGFVRTFSAFEQ